MLSSTFRLNQSASSVSNETLEVVETHKSSKLRSWAVAFLFTALTMFWGSIFAQSTFPSAELQDKWSETYKSLESYKNMTIQGYSSSFGSMSEGERCDARKWMQMNPNSLLFKDDVAAYLTVMNELFAIPWFEAYFIDYVQTNSPFVDWEISFPFKWVNPTSLDLKLKMDDEQLLQFSLAKEAFEKFIWITK